MTDHPQSLKAQNAWLMRAVLVLHGIVFAFIAFEQLFLMQIAETDALEEIKTALAPGSLSLAIIVVAKLVLLGLVPARLRDRLIHLRWRYPLPGSRAFTELGPRDSRVDMNVLQRNYGVLPTDPGEQDQLLYKVYRAHADEVGVVDAHKSYLAARDIGIINLLLFILLPGFAWWVTEDTQRVAWYSIALCSSYLLMAFTAQVYARRFVENVLAVASSGVNQTSAK